MDSSYNVPSDDLIEDESEPVLKPDGKLCVIKEQIIRDEISGLTFQFERDERGYTAFRIFGSTLPFGNCEIIFGSDGTEAATGMLVRGLSKPTWAYPARPSAA
ncbi:MAG TPA: hypothetical protein VGI81_15220 [Tepidisphaeraceae bacterium]|jgi:hypothetical protein